MTDDLNRLNALLRTSFLAFAARCFSTLNPGARLVRNWHIESIAYYLDLVRRGKIRRLIINLPPRSLKSTIVSVAFPAFLLGHDPRSRVFVVSYGADLAATLSMHSRSIIESPWYRRAFAEMVPSRVTDMEIETTLRGFRKATSIQSTITGRGGNFFIIDDPLKPIDALSQQQRDSVNNWYHHTLFSRMDNKETGAIVVVMQRLHLNDLTGFLLERSNEWTVLTLPAIAEADETIPIGEGRSYFRCAGDALNPSYESAETLLRIRNEVGSDTFAAQYQQAPVPIGGAMFKREWFRYFDTPPDRKLGVRLLQSWDTASKEGVRNDWSVCTTWLVVDKHDYFLLDVTRVKQDYPRLRATAIALAQRYDPNVILIEDSSSGTALAQEMRSAGRFRIQAVRPEHDKMARAYAQTAKFEARRVHFPNGASFLPELETELLSFPQGRHDDQVDSLCQALAHTNFGYDTTYSWVR
jgi:predicted phage terminase large subunit-like protein